jgi:cell division initiation protein
VTSQEILAKRFGKGMNGYKAEEVNAYLAEVAGYVMALQDEKDDLEKKILVLAEKLEEYREDEESLRAALIGAQKLGDSVVRDAKKNAETILAVANSQARELVADARSSLDRETISFSKMQNEIANFKSQILELYKKQIEFIEKGNIESKTPLTVMKAIQNMPQQPTPAQPESAPAPETSAGKAEHFVLKYEETAELTTDEGAPIPAKNHKRANYGDLRFGEEYNLTRKD